MNTIKLKTDCYHKFDEARNQLSDLGYVLNYKISFSFLKFKTIYTLKGTK